MSPIQHVIRLASLQKVGRLLHTVIYPFVLFFTTETRYRHYYIAVFIALSYWAFFLWSPGYYFVNSNVNGLEDWMLLASAATAHNSGVSLHSQFLTPWGFVYFAHAGIAQTITQFFLTNPSPFDLFITFDIISFLVVLGFMLLLIRFCGITFPLWLVIFILLLHLTPSELIFRGINWNANYNEFLACLCLIFIVASLQLFQDSERHLAKSQILTFGIAMGIAIFLALLYKINFGFALLCLFATVCIRMFAIKSSNSQYLISFASTVLGSITILNLFVYSTGYDFIAYASNLELATQAKSHEYFIVDQLRWGFEYTIQLPIICWLVHCWAKKDKKFPLSLLIFWVGIWTTVVLCFVGATSEGLLRRFLKYNILFIMIWNIRWIIPFWLKAILTVLFVAKYVSFVSIPLSQITWQFTVKINPSVVKTTDYITYDTPHSRFATQSGQIETRLFNMSPDVSTKKYDKREIYVKSKEEVIQIFDEQKIRIGKSPKVAVMKFADSLSHYRPDAIMKNKIHYKHLRVFPSHSNDEVLANEIKNANTVLIPKQMISNFITAGYFSCKFLRSPQARKFEYTEQTNHWHVFTRQSNNQQPQWINILQEEWFNKQCEQFNFQPSSARAPKHWASLHLRNLQNMLLK